MFLNTFVHRSCIWLYFPHLFTCVTNLLLSKIQSSPLFPPVLLFFTPLFTFILKLTIPFLFSFSKLYFVCLPLATVFSFIQSIPIDSTSPTSSSAPITSVLSSFLHHLLFFFVLVSVWETLSDSLFVPLSIVSWMKKQLSRGKWHVFICPQMFCLLI